MSTRTKPAPKTSDTVRLRPSTKADAEKAVAVETLAGNKTNLSNFISDLTDAVTNPLLRAAGIQPSTKVNKPKVTK